MNSHFIPAVSGWFGSGMLLQAVADNPVVIEGMNQHEIVLNTVNLMITATASIIIQISIAYIQAKFKKSSND